MSDNINERLKKRFEEHSVKNSPYQELFSHMAEEHGLTLLESELYDILSICQKINGGILLEKLFSKQEEVISSPLRFEGVSKENIIKVFEETGFKFEIPF